MKRFLSKIKSFLKRFSFRTGVMVLLMCVPCYIFSFLQMALPMDIKVKGILWVVFFGMAKTLQYTGITIIGANGVKKLKALFISSKKNRVENL